MGWASGHIPHHLLELLKPVHEGNPLNPTDHGTIHLFNKKKEPGGKSAEGRSWLEAISIPHCLWWWFKGMNWPSAQWWLNQCSTGGKEFPLQHSLCGARCVWCSVRSCSPKSDLGSVFSIPGACVSNIPASCQHAHDLGLAWSLLLGSSLWDLGI